MKKAKMLLTAVAVLAVVGGALAFKAKKGAVAYITLHSPTLCTFPVDGVTALTTSEFPNSYASTAPISTTCPEAETIELP